MVIVRRTWTNPWLGLITTLLGLMVIDGDLFKAGLILADNVTVPMNPQLNSPIFESTLELGRIVIEPGTGKVSAKPVGRHSDSSP